MFGSKKLTWMRAVLGGNLLVLLISGVLFNFFLFVNLCYHLNAVILPVLALADLGYRMIKRKGALKWPLVRSVVGVALLLVYYRATWVEPERFEIRELELYSEKITEPLTIVHLSDIQSNHIDEYEEEVFATVADFEPDLVVHTGDLIQMCNYSYYESELDSLASLFATLDAPVYHVNGDTDDPAQIAALQFDQKSGATTLVDAKSSVTIKNNQIELFGMTLFESRKGATGAMQHYLANRNPEAFQILLGHAPDYVNYIGNHQVDLALAGHTHGGQIVIPGIGPLLVLTTLPNEQSHGHTSLPQTQLNVSAGIGAEHAACLPSIRLNCPPEFTVIRILPVD